MNSSDKINLKYYKPKSLTGNFGDEMSPMLVNKITGRNIINTSGTNELSLIAIGSYIQMANNNDIIWGSGVRTINQPSNYSQLNVKAVRGPITKKYLEHKKIYVPEVYGDPALLFTKFFNIDDNTEYIGKIGLIPHYTTLETFKKQKLPSEIKIISPIENPLTVLSNIKSCSYIISSSLHGLIMADCFNKPNFWLYDQKLNEGILKFEDYYASQNRQIKMHNYIDNVLKSGSEDYGNKINLDLLLQSFPSELIKK